LNDLSRDLLNRVTSTPSPGISSVVCYLKVETGNTWGFGSRSTKHSAAPRPLCYSVLPKTKLQTLLYEVVCLFY